MWSFYLTPSPHCCGAAQATVHDHKQLVIGRLMGRNTRCKAKGDGRQGRLWHFIRKEL